MNKKGMLDPDKLSMIGLALIFTVFGGLFLYEIFIKKEEVTDETTDTSTPSNGEETGYFEGLEPHDFFMNYGQLGTHLSDIRDENQEETYVIVYDSEDFDCGTDCTTLEANVEALDEVSSLKKNQNDFNYVKVIDSSDEDFEDSFLDTNTNIALNSSFGAVSGDGDDIYMIEDFKFKGAPLLLKFQGNVLKEIITGYTDMNTRLDNLKTAAGVEE